MSVLDKRVPLRTEVASLSITLLVITTQRVGLITTTSTSLVFTGGMGFCQLAQNAVSGQGYAPARVPMFPELTVDILSQHIFGLLGIEVGRLDPKDQRVYVSCNTVLVASVICRVEF